MGGGGAIKGRMNSLLNNVTNVTEKSFGYKLSEETKKKISIANKGKTLGRKRPNHSLWMKINHPKGMRGKKHSEETKNKMANSHRGKKQSYEWRKKRSLAMSGEKHPNWKGGPIIPKDIKNKIRKSFEYKEWRKSVFKRDEYTCQDCGDKSGNGKAIYLEAHHIKSFALFPKLRFEITNGQTLCKKCHLSIL